MNFKTGTNKATQATSNNLISNSQLNLQALSTAISNNPTPTRGGSMGPPPQGSYNFQN
jgi:hypothetical protein